MAINIRHNSNDCKDFDIEIFQSRFFFHQKNTIYPTCFLQIISWALKLIAQNIYYLYAARLINGFAAGGVFVIVPLFTTEIAADRYDKYQIEIPFDWLLLQIIGEWTY